ncbi:MAG: aldehyde ferredoxin oxidoreductase family protein [bacterium]
MPNGYAGRLLFVDLTSGTVEEEAPDEDLYRKFIGGTGLGARILFERMSPGADPLGPESMLGFVTGPLTATGVYGGGRFTVVAKSPLTGGWGDSNAGGYWGPELKLAGYDAVFFTGISPGPVYLSIDGGRVELRDATHLWGRGTYETDDLLQDELGTPGSWRISCIGSSGERCSPLAGIVNEKGRIAARSGLGAVMGSKRLKAVAVRGKKGAKIGIADREGLRAVQKVYGKDLKESPFLQDLATAGTGAGTSVLLSVGDAPVRNWNATGLDSMPTCTDLDAANMDKYKLRAYGCHSCPVRCGALIEVKDGPYATVEEMHRPEYETLASLGTLCFNDEVETIIKANEICNRSGIDTIGLGNAVAFAVECYENGAIGPEETGGLELRWGDGASLVALTEKIAGGEGIGALLSRGVKEAAERIGKGTEEYAMHIGGRAIPYHDPRGMASCATHYIADAQPANHMGRQAMSRLESGAPLGPDPLLQPQKLQIFGDYDRKGEIFVTGSAYYQLHSSGGLCALYLSGPVARTGNWPPLVDLLRTVTGWDMDWEEALRTGRRILTLRQAFTAREGVRPQDFTLPKRFDVPIQAGPAAGQHIPFAAVKNSYFESMGWDLETGYPHDQTMVDLELNSI